MDLNIGIRLFYDLGGKSFFLTSNDPPSLVVSVETFKDGEITTFQHQTLLQYGKIWLFPSSKIKIDTNCLQTTYIFLNLKDFMIIYFNLYCITRKHDGLNMCLPDVMLQLKPTRLNNEVKAGSLNAISASFQLFKIKSIGCPPHLVSNTLCIGPEKGKTNTCLSCKEENRSSSRFGGLLKLMTGFDLCNLILCIMRDLEYKSLLLLEMAMEGRSKASYTKLLMNHGSLFFLCSGSKRSSSSSMMNGFSWSWITRLMRSSELAFLYRFHTCFVNGGDEVQILHPGRTSLKKDYFMYNLPFQQTISSDFYHLRLSFKCGSQINDSSNKSGSWNVENQIKSQKQKQRITIAHSKNSHHFSHSESQYQKERTIKIAFFQKKLIMIQQVFLYLLGLYADKKDRDRE
ncbi:hypothetical protein VP01_2657g1 [Puccinia sorghi]|uniref:Uncharacterized protein n=1 Tax=Puccinia sorghi TaxID=27349 RepID=A0A0L6V435_9BASI|nr:hypothetical protein VP01_2657g1 [Puccinia sorghi]